MQSNQVTERIEYADDRRRKGSGRRLVRLPGKSGFVTSDDSAELIAKRLRVEAMERRIKERGSK